MMETGTASVVVPVESGTVIRPAILEDLPDILACFERFFKSADYKQFLNYNDYHLLESCARLIEITNGTIIVSVKNDHVIGAIGIFSYTHPMNGEVVAAEMFWWSYDGRSGIRLFERAEQWAREQGATVMQMAAPTERLERFYSKHGFLEVETLFQKRL